MPAPTSGGNHRPFRAAAPGITSEREEEGKQLAAWRGAKPDARDASRAAPTLHAVDGEAAVVTVRGGGGVGSSGRAGGAAEPKSEEQSSPPLPPSPPRPSPLPSVAVAPAPALTAAAALTGGALTAAALTAACRRGPRLSRRSHEVPAVPAHPYTRSFSRALPLWPPHAARRSPVSHRANRSPLGCVVIHAPGGGVLGCWLKT